MVPSVETLSNLVNLFEMNKMHLSGDSFVASLSDMRENVKLDPNLLPMLEIFDNLFGHKGQIVPEDKMTIS